MREGIRFLGCLGNRAQAYLARGYTTIYRRMLFLTRLLNDTVLSFPPSLSLKITTLREKEAPAYNRFLPDQPLPLILKRLSEGNRCFTVWYNWDIVHGTWAATGQVYIPYLRSSLILSPQDVYLFNIYTASDYRRQGLALSTGAHLMQYYRKNGFRRTTALVAVENKGGLEMFHKLGYHPMGRYGCLRLGPFQWDWQQTWGEEVLPILTKAK